MTTYYYALYDDNYYGFYNHHSARSLKNALAGLRKLMYSETENAGVIATEKIPNGQMSRNPKGYVGLMNSRSRVKGHKIHNGRRVPVFAGDVYVWFGKGKKKGQMVMSDGSLRPYEGR